MYKKYRETKALKKEKSQISISKLAETKKAKPEWDFSVSDPDKYKLSQAEMVNILYFLNNYDLDPKKILIYF